jgi:hypothetical protein
LIGGPETYTLTSSQPWAVVGTLTNPNNAALNSTTVSLNLAVAPTTPGTYTATITLAGLTGSESAAVTNIVLIVAGPPSLTVGNGTGTAGTVATPGTPGTDGQTVNYTYGGASPTVPPIPISITSTVDNPTLTLTYSAITYSAGATGWLALTSPPATINDTATTLTATINPTGIAPANGYTATFTVTSNDPTGAIPANYSASVTYTVTLNVSGTLSVSAANSLFTYVIGTASPQLPLVITSLPSGVSFSVTTTPNLASSVMAGSTPNTPQITVNGITVTTPGVATGTITVSASQSALNCVPSVTVTVANGVCSVSQTFNLNVHSSFFTGESPIGGGFYSLTFPDNVSFGDYAYFPSQLAIYQTQLGEELLFTTTDSSDGIYMYDVDSGNIWYTSPSLYPDFYDFTTSQWLQYIPGSGNGTTGSRQFYAWTLNTPVTNPPTYTFTGKISK